jgi:dolichol-phosphate mannosyltransferase
VGFRQTDILFDVKERKEGKTSWSYRNLSMYALNAILLYSYIPLYTLLFVGVGSFVFGAILGIKLLADYFFRSVPSGYATLLAVSLLSFSIIIICTGILGLYLQKILDQVKGRPRYITRGFSKCD